MKKTILFFTAVFLCGAPQAQTTLTAEMRPRTEYRHGFRTLIDSTQDAAIFTSQRTRLSFSYATDKIRMGLVLQDVRTWGNQSQLNLYDSATFSLHQAWGEYFFTRSISLKAGRQPLRYDDERILGAVEWAQQGRSHDALLLKFSDDTLQLNVHIGAAYNQTAEHHVATAYTGRSNYKELYFLWVNKKINNLSISILNVNNGIQSSAAVNSTRFSHTVGTHIEYKKSAWFVNPRFYWQGGVDANKKEIQAYMGGLDVQYTLQEKITLGIGAEVLSGQSQTDTSKSYTDVTHNFSPLYSSGHKFNGYMDYFYTSSAHGNVGLRNVYLKTKYQAKKWWVTWDVHQFMAGAEVLDKKILAQSGEYKAMNSNLGTEIDLTFAYTFTPQFIVQAGYSHLFATETMQALKGGWYKETQNWAYLMLVFKPTLIKQ